MRRRDSEARRTALAIGLSAAIVALSFVTFGRWLLPRPRRSAPPAVSVTTSAKPADPDAPAVDDFEPLDRVTAFVRAEQGARIDAPGGIGRLDIPPGALRHDTTVSIVRYATSHEEAITPYATDLLPDGLRLRRPVRFELELPLGLDPEQAEIAVYEPGSQSWRAEYDQQPADDGHSLAAELHHFSLRRIRIRPGLNFPYDASRGRATFYLESDAGNTYERYIESRWNAVPRRSGSYRDLMRIHRVGRHELILSGRLRAVTAARPRPEVFRDHRRTVAMPPGVPQARTGWVRIRRLNRAGDPTGHEVIARVNDYGPGPAPRRAGVIVDMSRATAEALGLVWGRDFGLSERDRNVAWMKVGPRPDARPLRYMPVRVEAYEPRPPRAFSCRLP
ncbi:MAG: hypothetical protein JSV80_11365 [Acidobacteriota bacterium]|nr:MAG: hypothetical protein JSV80_11365 [Acidobacteriota bacterium]